MVTAAAASTFPTSAARPHRRACRFSSPAAAQDFPLDLGFKLFEKQKAVFVDTSYEFAPRWTLGLGARYLEEDIGVRLDGIGFLAPPPGASNGGEDSASKFNPAVSLRFKPNDDLTLYLQAAEGFRSGNANQTLPAACQEDAAELGLTLQAVTDPDTVRNYELGFKSLLAGRRINLNAAVYRLEWKDVPGTVLFPCNFSNLVNAGDATGKGVEFEMAARLGGAWKLNLSASYNDLTYDDNVLPQIGTPGEQIAGSPAKNYSAGLEYDFNLGSAWSGLGARRLGLRGAGPLRLRLAPEGILRHAQSAVGRDEGGQSGHRAIRPQCDR